MKRILSILCLLIATAAHAEFGGTTPPQTMNAGAAGNVLTWTDAQHPPTWALIVGSNITANSITTTQIDASLDIFGRNFIINPQGVVAQRPTAGLVANTLVYGSVDHWRIGTGANVTGGTAQQGPAVSFGQTGKSIELGTVSTSGSSTINFRTFIEAQDAVNLIGQNVYFIGTAAQNTGSTISNCTISIYKANSADFSGASTGTTGTYTAMTLINSVNTISLTGAGAGNTFTFGPTSMGACGNGVMIEFIIPVGTITNKTFDLTDTSLQIAAGTPTNPSHYRPYQQELALCQRYCCSWGSIANEPVGVGIAFSTTQCQVTIPHPVQMRAAPTLTNPGTLANFAVLNGGLNPQNLTALAISTGGTKSTSVTCTVAANLTAGQSAPLRNNNQTTDFLILSCDF